MKQLFFLSFMFFTLCAQAQTKRIFLKSHSGDVTTLDEALMSDEALEMSNFGVAPRPKVSNARLDSLIFNPDSSIIMVTSQYCQDPKGKFHYYKKGDHLWEPGRVVLTNHPFSRYKDKTQLWKYIDKAYHFRNKASSVVIIKKDSVKRDTVKKIKKAKEKIKKRSIPISHHDHTPPPPPSLLSIVLIAGMISLGMALLYHWLRPQQS